MNLTPKFLIKLLESNGFLFRRAKGSHHIYCNQESGKLLLFLFMEERI
jgi:predicted RNA binding protein YcfA (HicA-like mRNA interferase family)